MSKNPKPTVEELRFVYDLLLKGYEEADILAEYARLYDESKLMFPFRTDKRFIRERKRELEAAEAVIKDRVQRLSDPVLVKSKEQHFAYLAEIAESLLENDIGKVFIDPGIPVGPDYMYSVVSDSSEYYEITHSELVGRLESNVDQAIEKYGNWEVLFCFLAHLEAEYPEWGDLYGKVSANPIELVTILRTLSKRKTFKGTCPMCPDSQ